MSDTRHPRDKVLSWEQARRWRDSQKGRVVFTNGVFDLLHPGHVDLLHASRREGDVLIVAVNSDASVRRLGKGADRPVRSERERALVVAALAAVDAVVVFDQDTPLDIVKKLEPDVIVKGGDYTEDSVIGAKEVRARGGRVVIVPLTAGQSTTSIVEKLRGK